MIKKYFDHPSLGVRVYNIGNKYTDINDMCYNGLSVLGD